MEIEIQEVKNMVQEQEIQTQGLHRYQHQIIDKQIIIIMIQDQIMIPPKKNNHHKIIVIQEKVSVQFKHKCKQANNNIKYNKNKNNYYKN